MVINGFRKWLEVVTAGLVIAGIPSIIGLAIHHSAQLAKLQASYEQLATSVKDHEIKIGAIELLLLRDPLNHAKLREEFTELKLRFAQHKEKAQHEVPPPEGNK